MVSRTVQAKQQSVVGENNSNNNSANIKQEVGKGQDQIHHWLSVYSESRDPALRDSIIQASLPLVKRIAYGLARRSTDPVEDLIQVGSIGLIKAVDQFKPDAGA